MFVYVCFISWETFLWIRWNRSALLRSRLQQCLTVIQLVVQFSVSTSYLQNAFVQLSLAFRNDKYTLEMRLKQAERERNLTEEDTEKELEEFKGALKVSHSTIKEN